MLPLVVDAGASGALTILEPGDRIRPARFHMVLPPGYSHPVDQNHPSQSERVEVVSGMADVVIDGVVTRLGPGGSAVIPSGAWHKTGNPGGEQLVMLVELSPGLGSDVMFGRLFSAKIGTRGLGQTLALLNVLVEYPDQILFRAPIQAFFRVLVRVLRRVGILGAPAQLTPAHAVEGVGGCVPRGAGGAATAARPM